MRSFIIVCFFALAALAYAHPNGQYTDKYDNINLDEILGNDRLLKAYVECLLGTGKCTPEGTELKGHMKDALETECSKCTQAQKDGTRKVIKHVINKEPEYWNQLCAKYDPDRKYAVKYEKELKEVTA